MNTHTDYANLLVLVCSPSQQITAICPSCKQGLSGREKKNVLGSGIAGMRGSMVTRLQPYMVPLTPNRFIVGMLSWVTVTIQAPSPESQTS